MDEEKNKQKLWEDLHTTLKNDLSDHIIKQLLIVNDNLPNDNEDITQNSLIKLVSKRVAQSKKFKQSYATFLLVNTSCIENICSSLSESNLNQPLNISSTESNAMVLDENQLKNVTNLLRDASSNSKLKALNTLVPLLKVITNQNIWVCLEPHLHNCLKSTIPSVHTATQNLYLKMLNSNLHEGVKTSYTSLLSLISTIFKCMDMNALYNEASSIDSFKLNTKLLKIIHKFQLESMKQMKCTKLLLEDLAKSTVNFITQSVVMNSKHYYPNWDMYGLIDVECQWLFCWLQSPVTCVSTIELLSKKSLFLEYIFETANFSLEPMDVTKELSLRNLINHSIIKSIHAISFLSKLIIYEQGQIIVNDIYKSNNGWVLLFCSIINCSWDFCEKGIKTLENVFLETCKRFWDNGTKLSSKSSLQILTCLIDPLKEFSKFKEETILFSLKSLYHYTSSNAGKEAILWSKEGMLIFISFIETLNDLSLTEEKIDNQIAEYFILYLTNIVSHPRGVLWASNTQFNQIFANNFCREHGVMDKFSKPVHSVFSNLLSTFLSSPLGIEIIKESNFIESSIRACYEITKLNSRYCNCENQISLLICLLEEDSYLFTKDVMMTISKQIWQEIDILLFNSQEEYSEMILKTLINLFCCPQAYKIFNFLQTTKCTLWNALNLTSLIDKDTSQYLNKEELYLLGLKLLNVLICCVKTFVYLENEYKLTSLILDAQLKNVTASGSINVDRMTLLRNQILVRCFSIGGPNERFMPPLDVEFGKKFVWPLVTSIPLPSCYLQCIDRHEGDSFISHLADDGSGKIVYHLKDFLIENLRNETITLNFIKFCIEKISIYLPVSQISLYNFSQAFHLQIISYPNLSDIDKIGLQCAINYGNHLGIWNDNSLALSKLESMLKLWKEKLNGLSCINSFDIFISTIFILTKGDDKKANFFLKKFCKNRTSIFLWMAQCTAFEKVQASIWQWFEILLKENIPSVYKAFKRENYPGCLIYQHWVSQCFWNYLDIESIGVWIIIILLYGPEYTLYFALAVFKHLEDEIEFNADKKNIIAFLRTNLISNFYPINYLPFMKQMSRKYNEDIRRTLKNVCDSIIK